MQVRLEVNAAYHGKILATLAENRSKVGNIPCNAPRSRLNAIHNFFLSRQCMAISQCTEACQPFASLSDHLMQVLPAPLHLRPVALAEYFEVRFLNVINILT